MSCPWCVRRTYHLSVWLCVLRKIFELVFTKLKKKKKKRFCDDCHCPDSQDTTPPMKMLFGLSNDLRHERTTNFLLGLIRLLFFWYDLRSCLNGPLSNLQELEMEPTWTWFDHCLSKIII